MSVPAEWALLAQVLLGVAAALACFLAGRYSVRMDRSLVDELSYYGRALNTWLGSVPGTNAQIVASILAMFILLTGTIYLNAIGRPMDFDNLGLLVVMVTGFGGIAYKTFGKKRETFMRFHSAPPPEQLREEPPFKEDT